MAAKKSVLQLSVHEERIRKKVFVTVSKFPGVTSITMDDKTGKMTVVGDVDVSVIVIKLRKICNTEIVSVEVVKPPEKKPEEKKPEEKKPDPLKPVAYPVYHPYQYYPSYATNSYYHQPYATSKVVMDEPNSCVIM
ncbi:Heavy metal-associated isoprenylated plant protein 14 [Cardamine amara subsp. amara]|uniref:Heavy metal-associated isoprenylated plant protein 14 n=1 Tax=Cardamine amara subsp. amara TaxID=228776 RepID=A0ABD1AIX0_CARAN